MDMRNQLAALLGGRKLESPEPGMLAGVPNPSKAPIGSGMARRAMEILTSRPYQLHVQEAKAMGMTPMTPEEFAAQQSMRASM